MIYPVNIANDVAKKKAKREEAFKKALELLEKVKELDKEIAELEK